MLEKNIKQKEVEYDLTPKGPSIRSMYTRNLG